MATSEYSLTLRDYDGELSRTRVNTALITAGNIVAQQAAMTALQTAIGGITLGVPASENRVLSAPSLSSAFAASPVAQRESKWLVRSEDNVTHKIFRNEIPTADLTLLTNNSEYVTDFTPAALAAFKTAWEALVVSEDGNACTLRSLQAVGKRL